MDFIPIPNEVFIDVAKLLPVKDLLSCCLVNSYWRSAVNKNQVWKHHCRNNYNNWQDLAKCLETELPTVSPCDSIVVPQNRLEPLCCWRIHYIRKNKLSNNYKKGKFKKEKISIKCNNPCLDHQFAGEHDLVSLNLDFYKTFEVWNINGVPKLLGEAPYSLQHIMVLECFNVVNEHLIFVQCNLMQVYKVDVLLNSVILKYRRLFNETEECSQNIPSAVNITDWYMTNVGLYPSDSSYRCKTVGGFFIGMILGQNLKQTVFHIWDIYSGKKIKEEILPAIVSGVTITDIYFGSNTENIFVILSCTSSAYKSRFNIIYGYNVKNTCYTNCLIEINFIVPVILFGDNAIVCLNKTYCTISVWKSKSGVFIGDINESVILPSSLQVHGSMLIYALIINKIKIIDLDNLQTIASFEPNTTVSLCSSFLFVGPKFVFINKVQNIVYDIESVSGPLYTLKCKVICSNEIGTKLIAEESIGDENFLCILNFW